MRNVNKFKKISVLDVKKIMFASRNIPQVHLQKVWCQCSKHKSKKNWIRGFSFFIYMFFLCVCKFFLSNFFLKKVLNASLGDNHRFICSKNHTLLFAGVRIRPTCSRATRLLLRTSPPRPLLSSQVWLHTQEGINGKLQVLPGYIFGCQTKIPGGWALYREGFLWYLYTIKGKWLKMGGGGYVLAPNQGTKPRDQTKGALHVEGV